MPLVRIWSDCWFAAIVAVFVSGLPYHFNGEGSQNSGLCSDGWKRAWYPLEETCTVYCNMVLIVTNIVSRILQYYGNYCPETITSMHWISTSAGGSVQRCLAQSLAAFQEGHLIEASEKRNLLSYLVLKQMRFRFNFLNFFDISIPSLIYRLPANVKHKTLCLCIYIHIIKWLA